MLLARPSGFHHIVDLIMKRRTFISQTSASLAATALTKHMEAFVQSEKQRLNLLFITVDDMNWSLPGFMGGRNNLTPHLDKLASSSYQFVRNRTVASICQPSREATMTGRLPHHSGGLGFNPIHEGTPTLTTLLNAQGYFTAAIHKIEHMQPSSCFPWTMTVPGMGRAPSEYADAV